MPLRRTPSTGTRRIRIVVVNGSFVPGHADREVPFVRELRRRGYDVDYILAAERAAATGYSHPRDVQRIGRLRQIASTYCSSMRQLEFRIARADLVMTGMFKGSGTVSALAKRYGKLVGQYDYVVDAENPNIDFYGVIGEYFKEKLLAFHRGRSADDVHVTGSLQHDQVHWPETQESTRDEFCKAYGIDPRTKIALWLSTSPEGMNDLYIDRYKRVCETVRRTPGLTLMIKAHPSDHMKRQSDRFGRRHSWEVLAPGIPVVAPQDGYRSIRHCEVGITLPSAVVHEFALFRRPVACLDDDEYKASCPERWRWGWEHFLPSWVGITTNVDDLAEVLGAGRYRVADERLYDQHADRFCAGRDGQAYRSLADVVDSVVAGRLTRVSGLPEAAYAREMIKRLGERTLRLLGGQSGR